MVRMPGFGLDGPWRDNPAFAYVIEDASGISWLTGYPDRNPYEPYSVGDPNAGVHALNALLLALEHRRPHRPGRARRGGHGRRGAQRRRRAGDRVLRLRGAAAARRKPRADGGTAEPLPHRGIDEFGRHDCWVAIAVATDEQWVALRDALGRPDWARDAELDHRRRAARAQHDLIDEHARAVVLRSAPATRSSKHSGPQAFRWPR